MNGNKVLLITGASSSVGSEIINSIGQDYSLIWGHYCSSEDWMKKINSTIRPKVIPIRADFSVYDDTKNMISMILESRNIPTHIVHMTSPSAFNEHFHKCNWGMYQNSIDISIRSIVMLLETIIPQMVKNQFGRIVFMLSSYVLGGVPPKYQSSYITAKYALYGLMKNLAAEYAEKHITVNAVSPDMMETDFISNIPKHVINLNAEKNPLHRNIKVTDVVPAICYLLDDNAEAVTGQNIGVTGGVR